MRQRKNKKFATRYALVLGLMLYVIFLPLGIFAATSTLPSVTSTDSFAVTTSTEKPIGEVILDSLDIIGQYLGFSDVGLTTIVARLIRLFLSFIGIILVLIILYAGLIWMLSGGDEEKVATAKKTIINAIIGLIIILLSNSIIRFIVNAVGGEGGQ